MGDVRIQWHPGFVAAVDLELAANRDDLEYQSEHNLNVKPLEIDLLVIKKDPGAQLENEIGKLFLGHNIMEYKSPRDHLSVDDFYKAQAYATLYKSYGREVDERRADDITVSLVREAKPVKLLRYLKRHKQRVDNPCPGIYYVLDGVLFPTQIVVTGELRGECHAWLKALSERMGQEEMQELLERWQSLTEGYDRELADAVVEVSVNANWEMAERITGGSGMCKALMDLMEPEINKVVEAAVSKALAEEAAASKARAEEAVRAVEEASRAVKEVREEEQALREETASRLLRAGKVSPEELAEYMPGLSVADIQRIAGQLAVAQ